MARSHRRGRPSPRRVKQHATYDVAETARLLGVHRNTVRRWLKEGLEPLDGRRPVLIHGSRLKAFLAKRRENRKHTCRPGEFFCFRCRVPRTPWGGTADITPRNNRLSSLAALCAVCEAPMFRSVRTTDLSTFTALIDLKPLAQERLTGRSKAT